MGSLPTLLPVIRRADYGLGTDTGGPRPAMISRPFLPCLSEFLVLDLPDRMIYVTGRHLAEWDVTADDAFAAAHRNLHDRFRPLLDQRGTEPAATSFLGPGHTYFGSLPLLDGWLAAWTANWGGHRPVFVIANQSELLIAPAPEPDDAEAVRALLTSAEQEWAEAGRRVSPMLYTLDAAGRIVPFDVPADHPARQAIRTSWGLLAATVYDGQTRHLRANAELGDPFFAALQRFSRPDSDVTFTVATWSEDDMVLLPEADWVAFANDDGQFFVRFDDVVRECRLTLEPEYHPTRIYVDGWPEPEVLTRLRALAGQP